jgi:hypothetical protein
MIAWRLGKQVEHVRQAQKMILEKDDVVRYLSIVKSISLASWLVFDALGLAHIQKIITLKHPKETIHRTYYPNKVD